MDILKQRPGSFWHERRERFYALPPGERWRTALFWVFWVYMLLFASGYAVRDVFPVCCAICLAGYYRHDWQHSTLRRFPRWWLFAFFFGTVLWGVLFSQNVWASFLHVGTGLNKAFILPFIAMECVRDEKDLRRLVWAMALACLWQGLDGIWQSITGFDFVQHTPLHSGRLTGSLNDYRVGNYIGLMFIPTAAVWYVLREQRSRACSLVLLALLLGPACYLLYFTYTRNGYLAVITGVALWLLIRGPRLHWKPLAFAAAALLLAAMVVPQRLGVEAVARDGRWDLWSLGWAVFQKFPFTGAGFGQYNAAFRQLGLTPAQDPITISHPHNIYLQLLCESGVPGLILALCFLLGMLVWGWRSIREPLLAELARARQGTASAYWRMTALLWCGWGAYLASGIFGHDFFRDWWQALVMTHLGIMIGAVINGNTAEKP